MTELISTEANIARMRPFSMPAGETPAARPPRKWTETSLVEFPCQCDRRNRPTGY